MEIVKMILTILFLIVCLILVITVLLQEGKSAGLGSLGGMNMYDTFWSKHKGHTLEGKLEKATKIFVGAFMILALVLNILN